MAFAKRTVAITVAKVRFSPSVTRRYGYDDFGTRVNEMTTMSPS
jgi:hypothetical protein